jgi:hypothetical protein
MDTVGGLNGVTDAGEQDVEIAEDHDLVSTETAADTVLDGGGPIFAPPTITIEQLQDATVDLIISDDEAKASALAKMGICSIALTPGWSFHRGEKVSENQIPDLSMCALTDRNVYLCFVPSLAQADQQQVEKVEATVAKVLGRRGARVRCFRRPKDAMKNAMGFKWGYEYICASDEKEIESLKKEATAPPMYALFEKDHECVEAAMCFINDQALMTRTFFEKRQSQVEGGECGEIEEYMAKTVQIITSDRRIWRIPEKRTKDPEEVLVLESGYYLKNVPLDAQDRWSLESINAFMSGATSMPDLGEVYKKFLEVWKKWAYLPQEHAYTVMVLHVMGSYLYELWPAYPYLNLNGRPGSGKSTNGRVAAALGFNGRMILDPTQASMFRTIEREKPYMVIDEKENMSSRKQAEGQPGLSALLKAGYQKGGQVPRQSLSNIGHTEYFNVYSPKLICNVYGLEDILQERSILLATEVAPATASIVGTQPDPKDWQWQELRDMLYLMLMHGHLDLKSIVMRNEPVGDARGREAELFKPLYDMARWVDPRNMLGVRDIVDEAMAHDRELRLHMRECVPDEILLRALEDLLGQKDVVEVNVQQIKEAMARQTTDDVEYLSEKWIANMLRKSNIVVDKRDQKRKTVTWNKEGRKEQSKLTHYTIRRPRVFAAAA